MKILYDHQIFSSQKFGGISRYHIQLIKNLKTEWEIPLFFSNNFYLKELITAPEFFNKTNFRGKNRILERLNRIKTISTIKKRCFDVFHPTFYDSYAIEYIKDKPMVLTVHDMIHDRFPELPAAKWEMREKYIMAHRANAIIVPSQFTADELMALYNVPASKIHVVYHGSPEWEIPSVPIEENRFLFVGGRTYYKNFPVVLKALKLVPDSKLVVAGPPLNDLEKELINTLGINEQIKVVNPNDEELKRLYASSSALIFPSKMEGFGLPILEAFAANCPVICSDIPVFKEICGDAALFFNPDSPQTLAYMMQKNIEERFTENIIKRFKDFSWTKCGTATKNIYEEI